MMIISTCCLEKSTWIKNYQWYTPRQCPWTCVILNMYYDLPDAINVLIKLFADDAKLYSVVSSNVDNLGLIQSYYRAIDRDSVWKMIFNIIKCHHVHIGKNITGTIVTQWNQMASKLNWKKLKHEKVIGVIIDQNLTFTDHTGGG